MSAKERVRLDAMHRIERNEVTVVSSAVLMCVSLRQARRLWASAKTTPCFYGPLAEFMGRGRMT